MPNPTDNPHKSESLPVSKQQAKDKALTSLKPYPLPCLSLRPERLVRPSKAQNLTFQQNVFIYHNKDTAIKERLTKAVLI